MKPRTQFVCQECGYISPKWIGRCPNCQRWNAFAEETGAASSEPSLSWNAVPVLFNEIAGQEVLRFASGLEEFDRVLGGGVVPGALVLLGGDPGVGKSTLMLDVAARFAISGPVLYASGEESAQQIKIRGDRMGIKAPGLHVYAEMCIGKILKAAEDIGARVVIIDSVQTTFSDKLEMSPGTIGQVREVASQLLFWCKKNHVPVFLIGHVTKDGALAGPKALEHIVDAVLYFEGPRQHPHRIVRTIKNRFGPANELGIFTMASEGLRAVDKPSALFLAHSGATGPGSAVLCCVEGSRPLLVEIQALASRTHFGAPRRLATGVDPQRLALICAVLEQRLGTTLWDQDIYLNVVGGLQVEEPAADLAIAAAILSSLFNRPIAPSTLVFGEIGLGGEIRPAMFSDMRIKEARLLGFRRFVVPRQSAAEIPASAGETIAVDHLQEARHALFD